MKAEQLQANLQHSSEVPQSNPNSRTQPLQQLNEELKPQAKGSNPDLMDFGEPVNAADEEKFKSGERCKICKAPLTMMEKINTDSLQGQCKLCSDKDEKTEI